MFSFCAVRCYQRSLQLKSSYCRGWSNLGIAFMTQKLNKDAAKCFMRSLKFGALFPCTFSPFRFDLVLLIFSVVSFVSSMLYEGIG